jgi:hypothetical protein
MTRKRHLRGPKDVARVPSRPEVRCRKMIGNKSSAGRSIAKGSQCTPRPHRWKIPIEVCVAPAPKMAGDLFPQSAAELHAGASWKKRSMLLRRGGRHCCDLRLVETASGGAGRLSSSTATPVSAAPRAAMGVLASTRCSRMRPDVSSTSSWPGRSTGSWSAPLTVDGFTRRF